MDISKTVVGVVGLVVCMLMVAYAAIPTIENAAFEKEYSDNAASSYRYDVVRAVDITYDGTSFTMGGQTVTVPSNTIAMFTDSMRIVFSSEKYYLSYASEGTVTQVQLASGDTISLESGRYTFDPASGDPITGYYNQPVLVYNAQGDYVSLRDSAEGSLLYRSDLPIYVTTGSSTFLSFGKIVNAASEDGSITVVSTGSKIVVDLTWTMGTSEDGVPTISAPAMTVNDTDYVPALFAPFQYYTLVEGDSTTSTLFAVVGTLLIISLVTMAVRLFTGRE